VPEGNANLQGPEEDHKDAKAVSVGQRHRRDKQQPLSFGMSIAVASVCDTSVRIKALTGSNQIASSECRAQLASLTATSHAAVAST
jgi:hypothetical protein